MLSVSFVLLLDTRHSELADHHMQRRRQDFIHQLGAKLFVSGLLQAAALLLQFVGPAVVKARSAGDVRDSVNGTVCVRLAEPVRLARATARRSW